MCRKYACLKSRWRLFSDLEVLVTILYARHAFFPVTHALTTEDHLLNAQIPASRNSYLRARGTSRNDDAAYYMINRLFKAKILKARFNILILVLVLADEFCYHIRQYQAYCIWYITYRLFKV